MSNQSNNSEYLRKVLSFFKEYENFTKMKLENEKYNKCIELINHIPNIELINDGYKLEYYTYIGELYYYISKIKTQKHKLSNGEVFDRNAILKEENKKYLDEILNYKILSFDCFEKSLNINYYNQCVEKFITVNPSAGLDNILKKINSICDRNKEQFRIISQDLCVIYYIINDEDKFISYGNNAIKYGSLNATTFLLKYYCDKMDYDNADYYYELMNGFDIIKNSNNPQSVIRNIIIKLGCYPLYFNYLYNSGMYEESLKIGRDYKRFIINNDIINNKMIEDNYNLLENAKNHIEKCKNKIEESKATVISTDLLKKYFDVEVLKIMNNDNKTYILTSLNIYEYMKASKIQMDYSATLMPILKAIESIIFDIVAKEYLRFLLEKNESELNKDYIEAFINKKTNRILHKIDRLEIGSALKLIGYKEYYNDDKITPNIYFNEFCTKNGIEDSESVIIKIYEELDTLREKRNLVAHKNRVYEECVKECYEILLDDIKFINYLYTVFKFVFENK